LWLGAAGVAALIVAGIILATVTLARPHRTALHHAHSAGPTRAVRPTLTPTPTATPSPVLTIVTPRTAGGLALDPLDETPATRHVNNIWLRVINTVAALNGSAVSSHRWAVYQGGTDPVTGGPALVLFVGGEFSVSIPSPLLFVKEYADTYSDGSNTRDIPTGPAGGAEDCAKSYLSGGGVTTCIWATNTTFGVIIPYSSSNWTIGETASLLQAMRPDLEPGDPGGS
jgi:hypothetical protein